MGNTLFFHNAATAICGAGSLETALHALLVCIRDRIPVDFLSLHLFDHGLGIMETAIDVTHQGPVKSSRTILDRQANQAVQQEVRGMDGKPCFTIIDNVALHPAGGPLVRQFGIERAPCLVLDLFENGGYLGAVSLLNLSNTPYLPEHGHRLLSLHDLLSLAIRHHLCQREIEDLTEVIRHNNARQQPENREDTCPEIVGADAGLQGVMTMVEQIAPLSSPVLILGETGTGKEIVAKAIHFNAPCRQGPFVKVNCGAISPMLIDSELFGHEKGAFTGAVRRHRGFFERALGGTIFLDEIGELPLEAQARLLRVVQENVIERVGGTRPLTVDTRILAATHRDLEQMVAGGRFRQDLFFRLNVFPIQVPPLRQRQADIPALAEHFVRKKSRALNFTKIPRVKANAVDRLMDYPWPGNVRELENVVERELIIHREGKIDFSTMGMGRKPKTGAGPGATLDRVMADHITRTLHKTRGRVEGENGAARILGIHPRTLRHRMAKMGIPFGKNAGDIYSRQSTGK